jgi:hypothetical protein
VENSLWQRLWTWCKADCSMNRHQELTYCSKSHPATCFGYVQPPSGCVQLYITRERTAVHTVLLNTDLRFVAPGAYVTTAVTTLGPWSAIILRIHWYILLVRRCTQPVDGLTQPRHVAESCVRRLRIGI